MGRHCAALQSIQENTSMKSFVFARALGAAVVVLAAAGPARADVKDYEFQLVQQELKKGEAIIAVRLINKKTGQTVPSAVFVAKRLDMAPDSMPEMATRIDALPSTEPGVYRFKAN